MSSVTTQPEMLAVAAGNSHGFGSAIKAHSTAVAAPVIGVTSPAANEVGSDCRAIRRARRDVAGGRHAGSGDPRDFRERTGYEQRIGCDQRDRQCGRSWVRMWR